MKASPHLNEHQAHRILAAGIPRSGSTWLFNATRIVLESAYPSVFSCWIEDYRGEFEGDVQLIKLHAPDDAWRDWADLIVLTRRDLRDIAVSLLAMGWAKSDDDVLRLIRMARGMHDYWARFAQLELAYETIITQPLCAFRQLVDIMDFDRTTDDLAAMNDCMPITRGLGDGRYDRRTLLHPGHVTDGRSGRWRDQLRPDLAGALWGEHADWLTAHGYNS